MPLIKMALNIAIPTMLGGRYYSKIIQNSNYLNLKFFTFPILTPTPTK